MSINLFLGRISCLSPSLPLNQITPFASSNAPTQASPPNAQFAVQYLVESCGLSSDKALKASKYIHYLQSPDKPDKVLRFLRDTGIRESDIKTAVSRRASILCSNVEKNWRPNITKLQEVGFSMEDISGIISENPDLFGSNFVSKIEFWMGVLGSVENLSAVFKVWRGALIARSLEKVIMPNVSLLLELSSSTHQILRVIKSSPKMISNRPEYVKSLVERVDKLGIPHSSASFIEALITVSNVNESLIDTKLNNLRNIGFSQEEVAHLIIRFPSLLTKSEKLVARKMEFLMKEAGCDKLHVIRNPFLFCCNLENRLIPRNIVRKLLMLKGIPVPKFATFVKPSDEKFVEKFVLPYEPAIPGLHRAFADAVTIEGIDQL